jgi:hypothetical protein
VRDCRPWRDCGRRRPTFVIITIVIITTIVILGFTSARGIIIGACRAARQHGIILRAAAQHA